MHCCCIGADFGAGNRFMDGCKLLQQHYLAKVKKSNTNIFFFILNIIQMVIKPRFSGIEEMNQLFYFTFHSHLVAFMDLFQPSLKRLGNTTYFLE